MNLNITAPINNLGYGVVGLNVVKQLFKDRVNLSFFPIGQPQTQDKESIEIITACMKNAGSFKPDAPSLRIWHQHDMAQHVGSGRRVGFPIFELDRFNDVEKHHLSTLDNIIVCSEWAKKIIQKEIPSMEKKVEVVPLGVDTSIFDYKKLEKWERPKNLKTVFLNVGKWEVRKGHDILVEAFNGAFTEKDEVELWMMNSNPFLKEEEEIEWQNLYTQSPLGSKIRILPRVESHAEVATIMNNADVGIFPSRAEGWNLEALEMMALGKQVILTDYSAHTEFANEKNSKLIQIDSTEEAHDGIWFHGQGEWGTISQKQISQIIKHMKDCHKTPKEISFNANGVATASEFSWKNCSEGIQKICGNMPGF